MGVLEEVDIREGAKKQKSSAPRQYSSLWSVSRSVSRISISSRISYEDRRPKLLETGAVGRVQGYKRGEAGRASYHYAVNTVLLLLLQCS